MVLAEALTRAKCKSASGATPSKARAPSNTEEPSQIACVRTPQSGRLPSCHSPSKKVQVCDQVAAIEYSSLSRHLGKTIRLPVRPSNDGSTIDGVCASS